MFKLEVVQVKTRVQRALKYLVQIYPNTAIFFVDDASIFIGLYMVRVSSVSDTWLVELDAMQMIATYIDSADQLSLDLVRILRKHRLGLSLRDRTGTDEALDCIVNIARHTRFLF